MCSALVTTGVGLRIRPQLLPSVFGCVLYPAVAKEESLCRDRTKRRKAHLLHSLLLCTLHLLYLIWNRAERRWSIFDAHNLVF